MALNLNKSVLEHKKEATLDPSVDPSTLERGMVMVRSGFSANGEVLVAPSAGVANEDPVGILWLASTRQSQSPLIEELTIPSTAPLTLTLRESPTAVGEVRAYRRDTGAAITVVAGNNPSANQIAIDTATKVLTADATLAGVGVNLVYRFNISAATLERRAGKRSVNNDDLEGLYGQVTLAYGKCIVYTSLFDTEDAFEVDANVIIKSGAGGRISLDGNGTDFGKKVQKPIMLQTPGLEQAFVGYTCDLPGV